MDSDHDLDPGDLSPSDAQLLEIIEEDETHPFRTSLHYPECDQSLAVTAPAESIGETEIEVSLDDAEERYD